MNWTGGVTFLQGEGAYSRRKLQVLLVVLKLTQLAQLKAIVQEEDPQAFVAIQDVNEVVGKGFTW